MLPKIPYISQNGFELVILHLSLPRAWIIRMHYNAQLILLIL